MAFVLWITLKATQCLREVSRNIFVHVICVVKLETLQLRAIVGEIMSQKSYRAQVTPTQVLQNPCVSFW